MGLQRSVSLACGKNGLVRVWTHQQPKKLENLLFLFEKAPGPSQTKDSVIPGNKELSDLQGNTGSHCSFIHQCLLSTAAMWVQQSPAASKNGPQPRLEKPASPVVPKALESMAQIFRPWLLGLNEDKAEFFPQWDRWRRGIGNPAFLLGAAFHFHCFCFAPGATKLSYHVTTSHRGPWSAFLEIP